MISFSKNILTTYPEVTDFTVFLEQKGCAGNKIRIEPKSAKDDKDFIQAEHNLGENITIWVKQDIFENINHSQITLANGSWIFSNKNTVLTRCGCGKSFSLKTGDAIKDKITLLKAKMKQYKHQ